MKLDRRALIASAAALPFAGAAFAQGRPTPVIFHTDIGYDIDDSWALLYLLRRPELDLKMVVTDVGNTGYRARVAAKLLALGGRGDVPIAIAGDGRDDPGPLSAWIGKFRLEDHPGLVTYHAVTALAEAVKASPEPVTIISVGPATALAAAVSYMPQIARNARFVGMFGAVRVGYGGKGAPEAEYNVKTDPAALRTVLAAQWLSAAITPVDTCGVFNLDAADMGRLAGSADPFAQAALAGSRAWLPNAPWMPKDFDLTRTSSTLFDVVAVQMAFDTGDLVMEELPIGVTDEGMTVIDPAARPIQVATAWKDMAAARARLVTTLTARG